MARWMYEWTEALAVLAPHLSEPLLREALKMARWRHEKSTRQALAVLGPYLTEPLLREALEAARGVTYGYYRAPRC